MHATPAASTKRRPTKARELATARFEARLTHDQKAQLQQAADLSGRSLTDFVVASAQQAAHKLLQERDAIRLSREGQAAFVSALLAVKKPNARLRRAAALYRERMGL